MLSDRERLQGDLTYRAHLIVGEERARLARRRPDLGEADLEEVDAMLWRIAEALLLRQRGWTTVDAVAAARLWDRPDASGQHRGDHQRHQQPRRQVY